MRYQEDRMSFCQWARYWFNTECVDAWMFVFEMIGIVSVSVLVYEMITSFKKRR